MALARRLTILSFLLIAGCVSGVFPKNEYTLARAAIDAAKAVEASRFSPGYWSQAEESYRRGQVLIEEREFEEAKKEFLRAKIAAERAENSARLIRQKKGEVL